MSKNELRSSGERRRRGFANGAGEQQPFYVRQNHSKSADLLRKSLLSHVWRVPSSKVLSCKHERLFDLLTLVSFNFSIISCKCEYTVS